MTRILHPIPLAAMLALAGCSTDQGLVSVHQPVVASAGATVPGCPDWSDQDRPVREAQSSNFGCATAMNLAAMIADPADLIHGKTGTGTRSGEIAARAVKSLRDTAPTGKNGLDKVSSKAGS